MTQLKSATTKSKSVGAEPDFEWEPEGNQIYDVDSDRTLIGTPESFNKHVGHSFTMNAPANRTLRIEPTAVVPWSDTGWGDSTRGDISNGPSVFDIRSGTFSFAVGGNNNALNMATSGVLEGGLLGTKFTVFNNAKFIVDGTGAGYVLATEGLMLRVQDHGSVAMAAPTIQLDGYDDPSAGISLVDQGQMSLSGGKVWIETMRVALADNAQMSINANSVVFGSDQTGIVTVASTPSSSATGQYSLDCASATTTQIFTKPMYFSESSRTRFRGPKLEMRNAQLDASDHAKLHMQFDSFDIYGDLHRLARFILNPDNAVIQLDGYSVNDPFDFRNKASQYSQGIFELRTGASAAPNNSEFIIKNAGGAFAFTEVLAAKLISVDGEPQSDLSQLEVSYDPSYYTHIKLKPKK